jgi:superfamily II DNA or RNA helicase
VTLFETAATPRLMPHQAAAVETLLAIVRHHGGAILADDVGLGKTHTACAVARSYQECGYAIGFIVPVATVAHWRSVGRSFGIDAAVVTHDAIQSRGATERREPRFVIVDEAHRFRNRMTRRHRALAENVSGAAVLLVTATPLWNRPGELEALLTIFAADDQFRFDGIWSLEELFRRNDVKEIRRIIERVIVRRTCEEIEAAVPAVKRADIFWSGGEAIDGLVLQIRALEVPLASAEGTAHLLRAFLERRLASSVAALQESAIRQRRYLEQAIAHGRQGVALSRGDFRRIFGDAESPGEWQRLMFPEAWRLATGKVDLTLLTKEMERIETLIARCAQAPDRKLQRFARWQAAEAPLPAVVFTGASVTAAVLFERLRETRRVAMATARAILGSEGAPSRLEWLLERFARGEIDLLICTDLASEGISLAEAASVIHYDLPWTDVRLRQREGRAARLCSSRQLVHSFTFRSREGIEDAMAVLIEQKRSLLELVPLSSSEGESPARQGRLVRMEGRSEAVVVWLSDRTSLAIEGGKLILDAQEICRLLSGARIRADEPLEISAPELLPVRLRLASRRFYPGRIDERSVQWLLSRRLRLTADVALSGLLSRRYRRGIESSLQRKLLTPGLKVNGTRLSELLAGELALRREPEVVAAVVMYRRRRKE